MPINGRALRAKRRAAEITVVDIAARMKLSRQTVHTIERDGDVDPEQAAEYRKALDDAIKASRDKVA